MHSLGNDFVIIDARPGRRAHGFQPTMEGTAWACDRHEGIGADQLVVIDIDEASDTPRVRFFNVDGKEVGACGNASRCVGRLLLDESPEGTQEVRFLTRNGFLFSTDGDEAGTTSVRLPAPHFEWSQVPLADKCDAQNVPGVTPMGWENACCMSMGNPQCVLFAPPGCDLSALDLEAIAAPIERNPIFPEGVNVMLVVVDEAEGVVKVRPWERGAGATQACSTGAAASVVAAALRKHLPPSTQEGKRVTARVDFVTACGGNLMATWRSDGAVELVCEVHVAFVGHAPRGRI